MRLAGGSLIRLITVLVVAVLAVAVPVAEAGVAATKSWIGPAGGLWSTAANWSPAGVPENGDSIVLPEGSSSVFDLNGLQVVQLTVTSPTTFAATTLGVAGSASLVITGGVTLSGPGELDIHPRVSLTAGPRPFASGGPMHLLGGMTGAGGPTVSGTGYVALTSPVNHVGATRVESGGTLFVEGPTIGSAAVGTTLAHGANLGIESHSSPNLEPILVEAGSGPRGQLYGTGAFGGPIDLQGSLDVTFSGEVSSTISGPGRLFPRGFSFYSSEGYWYFDLVLSGANTYTGGTELVPNSSVGIRGTSALGTGVIDMTAPAAIFVAGAARIEPDISLDLTQNQAFPLLVALADVEVNGAITSEGTGRAVVFSEGGSLIDLVGGIDIENIEFLGSTQGDAGFARIAGPTSIDNLTVGNVTLEVEAPSGVQSIGTTRIVDGTLNLRADGLHAADTTMTAEWTGVIDLWGTDHHATTTTLVNGVLYLGVISGSVDASRLTLSGGYSQDVTSEVDFVFGSSAHDQIRAPSVSLAGDFRFFHDGSPAVGQSFRVIDNTGGFPVQGTFANSPEGSDYQAGPQLYRLSYRGGTGNDVTFTRLPGLHSTWLYGDVVEHGGGMRGGPALSSWGPGRVDAWVSGLDRSVWHRFSQAGLGAGWEGLGGITLSTPAAVSQQPGQADVFIRGADNALWMRSYRNGWGPWTSLGGILTDAPSVTSSSPGNVAVAIRGADGAIWLRRMVNNVWQGWRSFGGGTTHTPAVTDWGDGRLDLFIRGLDGAFWQQPILNGSPAGWISHGGIVTDAPAVAAPSPGELAVYIRGADGILWHRSWEGSFWTDWRSLELPIDVRPAATGVGRGELELGVRGFDGSLWTFNATSQAYEGDPAVAAASTVAGRPSGGFASVPVDERRPAIPR